MSGESYKREIVRNILNEIAHKIDRNFEDRISNKRDIIDVVLWAKMELDKRHRYIEKAKHTIPTPSSRSLPDHDKDQPTVSQDSEKLPSWLLNEQES